MFLSHRNLVALFSFSLLGIAELFSWSKELPVPSCYLIVEATSGMVLESSGEKWLETPLPIGSLIKPFTCLAAIETDRKLASLVLVCTPTSPSLPCLDGCWFRAGHGSLNMEQALSVSCDRYFRYLAERTSPFHWKNVLKRYGLYEKEEETEILSAMVGTSEKLKAIPVKILCAYLALGTELLYDYQSKPVPGKKLPLQGPAFLDEEARRIISGGLAGCLSWGTGSNPLSIGESRLAGKTGTSSFAIKNLKHSLPTCGWFAGYWPEKHPRLGIVVFLLEGRGQDAAIAACHLISEARKKYLPVKSE